MAGGAMKFNEKNMGQPDRMVRGAVAAALLLAVIFRLIEPPLFYVAFLFGLLLMWTAVSASCGLYSLIGFSTNGRKK